MQQRRRSVIEQLCSILSPPPGREYVRAQICGRPRNVNVNNNVNVNRNVNVNTNYHRGGGCYNCYYHDNDWNWGSFAAGAAVGVATTAVVAAATRPSTTVVVAAPAIGTMVPALPGGCANINSGGVVLYNCSNVYYRPYYQGTTLGLSGCNLPIRS